jgi:CheY-like chemotaxis protein
MNEPTAPEPNPQARILIVDDVPANIQLIANMLSKEAFQISAALSGAQALGMVERVQPDLVLLDVTMPVMDGFETCRQLKALPVTAEVPVIFLTGRASEEDVLRGFEAGGVDYVSKPFSHPELMARVQTHLRLRRLVEVERRQRLELQASMAQIKQLSGLLPICARCKCIRDDQGYWSQLEQYLSDHADVAFTHGICPACARELYPEMFDGKG